jgi:F-type H+-transporting ATPase subunit a
MEKLEHPLLIVQWVNWLLGPVVVSALRPLGITFKPGEEVIPGYLVMCGLIVVVVSLLSLVGRSRLSVDNPGKIQIVVEDLIGALDGMLNEYIGPKGRRYLSLVGSVGIFILIGNLAGLVPGAMAPTSNINVTLGCALTVWVFYHLEGFRQQGIIGYMRHFAAPPGAPMWMAPIYLPIELISHTSRVLSLSVRLFGNIFGEELVILILFSIVPFFAPLPMMFLGIITATLQAFIFVMLTIIYLQGAVAVEHHDEGHGHYDEGEAAFGAV